MHDTHQAVVEGGRQPAGGVIPQATVESTRQATVEALESGADVVLACDPTLEGVLGAIGIGYLAHANQARVRLEGRLACQPRLGETVVDTPPDSSDDLVTLARRVYKGLERCVGEGCPHSKGGSCPSLCAGACARRIVYASASDDPAMPEAVHRYVRRAFEEGSRMRSLIADEQVVALDELARYVLGECEHTRQFARFSLLADGSLFAVFRPNADTIPLTAGYFARRMGQERFCIVDPVHRSAAFHDAKAKGRGRRYVVVRLDQASADQLAAAKELSPNEGLVRSLWKRFYESVALPGRDASQRSYDLRAHWMPKRFWAGLTELDPRIPSLQGTLEGMPFRSSATPIETEAVSEPA